jgi:sec-independent protein translocase protein TatB
MMAIHLTGLGVAALASAPSCARIQTASIGIPDTLFLMLLALVVFGPRRLPEIGRQIGKLMYEFRKVSNDFKFQMEEELRASEEADRLRKAQAAAQIPVQAPLMTPIEPLPAESAQLELASGSAEALPEPLPQAIPAVDGEVRAETPKPLPIAPPSILPPSTGEPIAAQRPFRGRFSEAGTEQDVPQTAGTEEEVRHG